MIKGSSVYYYSRDGLGSIINLADSQGNVVESYTYDEYGIPSVLSQSNINNRYMFTGRELDEETGLYYYRARYYDPNIGRFLSEDPLTWAPDDRRILTGNREELINDIMEILKADPLYPGNPDLKEKLSSLDNKRLKSIILQIGSANPQLLHKYVYCLNNPVNYSDPEGEIVGWMAITASILIVIILIEELARYTLFPEEAECIPGPPGPAQQPYTIPPLRPWTPPGR